MDLLRCRALYRRLARLAAAGWLCGGLAAGSGAVLAQSLEDVELELREDRSAEYESYLLERESTYYARLDTDRQDDAARAALLIAKVGRVAFEVGRAQDRVDAASRDLADQLEELIRVLQDEVTATDTESAAAFLRALRERFVEDMAEDLRARLEAIRDQVEADNDEIDDALADLDDALAAILDDFGSHVDELRASGRDFSVTFRIAGGGFGEQDLLQVSRATLDDLGAAGDALADAAAALSDAVDLMDRAEEAAAEVAADNAAAIQRLREALDHLDAALATIQQVLDDQPFALDDVAPADAAHGAAESLRQWAADLDSILAGRTFTAGDMVVRPVALVESRTPAAQLTGQFVPAAIGLSVLAQRQFARADERDAEAQGGEKARLRGWLWVMLAASSAGFADPPGDLFAEFYSAPSPADYTFRGYFPEGLSPAMVELIGADLIVNTRASRAELDAHMAAARAGFQTRLAAAPGDAEANVGLAIARTYFLVVDNHRDVLDAVQLAVDGDIAGLVERFDMEDFDYGESLDSTRANIDTATQDRDVVFVVVDKRGLSGDLFRIEPQDEIALLPLSGRVLAGGLDIAEALGATAAALAEGVDRALSEMDRSVDLDLDPNLLDFSGAESGLDFALALEASNPDFLRISDAGRDDLQRARGDIADLLGRFSEAVTELRKLIVALEDEDLDAGLAAAAVDLDDFYQQARADFDTPEEITAIGGTDVNLSAWFDAPPDSLLQRFIWLLDDDPLTDGSLGGLLPDEVVSAVRQDATADRPRTFLLEPGYPNPFNAATTIPFQLAAERHVILAIHDATGQRVRELVHGTLPAGHYAAVWDGLDGRGRPAGSGLFVARMRAGGFEQVRKLALVR